MFSTEIRPDAASVGAARAQLVHELRLLEVSPQSIDDAELVLAELLTNAIVHSRPRSNGTVRACWAVLGDCLTIEVTDGGSGGRARVRDATRHDTSGRGLQIVEALSVGWGTQRSTGSTTVWARIPLSSTRYAKAHAVP